MQILKEQDIIAQLLYSPENVDRGEIVMYMRQMLMINLRCLMGKPTFCIGENKDADQLRGNREADQCLCFCYSDNVQFLFYLNPKFQASSSFLCLYRPVCVRPENHIVGFPTRRLI